MKKNYKVLALAGLAAAVAVGGTFAYYTSSDNIRNQFNTKDFGTTTVEIFNPEDGDKWEPGVTVDKAVYGRNTGDGDVYVRISFDEKWTRDGASDAYKTLSSDAAGKKFYPTSGDTGLQENATDGNVPGDSSVEGSVVYKNLMNTTTVAEEDDEGKWYAADDGWFYYTKVLKPNDTTNTLLSSLTLCGDIDMGDYADIHVFRAIPKTDDPKAAADDYIPKVSFAGDGSWSLVPEENVTWYEMKEDGTTDAEGNKIYFIPKNADGKVTDKEGNVIKNPFEGGTFFSYVDTKLNPEKPGYSNSQYNLYINVEYVQADKDKAAISQMTDWEWYPGKDTTVAP